MLLKNKTNNNGYCTPLAYFPELEGKVEPIFLAISEKPTDEEQKQLDSLKNYKKLDRSSFNTRAYRKEYLHFVDLYNQILGQHYASKVKELKK